MAVTLTCTNTTTGFAQWFAHVTDKEGHILFTSMAGNRPETVLMAAVDHLVSRVEVLENALWKDEYAGTDV